MNRSAGLRPGVLPMNDRAVPEAGAPTVGSWPRFTSIFGRCLLPMNRSTPSPRPSPRSRRRGRIILWNVTQGSSYLVRATLDYSLLPRWGRSVSAFVRLRRVVAALGERRSLRTETNEGHRPPLHPGSQREYPVHALCQVAGGFHVGGLVAGLFGDRPSGVASVVQGLHHRRPVGVALEQFGTGVPPGGRVRGFRAVVLDVNAEDAFANHLNPAFGRSDAARVADVEMPAHPFAVDGVEVFDRLLGGHDEIVTDIFDGDLH